MKRLRTRIRELTDARRSGVTDVRVLIARLNPVLRGWGNYFRTGNATRRFTQIDRYVRYRLGLFLARRQGVRHRHGAISRWSFDWFWGLGLHRLFGTVRYPDAAHA
jgi:RNA-directed DNA polymerase